MCMLAEASIPPPSPQLNPLLGAGTPVVYPGLLTSHAYCNIGIDCSVLNMTACTYQVLPMLTGLPQTTCES